MCLPRVCQTKDDVCFESLQRVCRCIHSHAIPNCLFAFYQRHVKLKRPLINSISIRGYPSEVWLPPLLLLLRRPCLMHYCQPALSCLHTMRSRSDYCSGLYRTWDTFSLQHLHSCKAITADTSLHPLPVTLHTSLDLP